VHCGATRYLKVRLISAAITLELRANSDREQRWTPELNYLLRHSIAAAAFLRPLASSARRPESAKNNAAPRMIPAMPVNEMRAWTVQGPMVMELF